MTLIFLMDKVSLVGTLLFMIKKKLDSFTNLENLLAIIETYEKG